MPDLMTHFTASYLIKRSFCTKRGMTSFLAGATLPDLLGFVPLLLTPLLKPLVMHGPPGLNSIPDWFKNLPFLFLPFHSLIPFVLFSYLVALMFPLAYRRTIFMNMTLGALFHFFLDFLQIRYQDVSYLLFPFSWRSFGLGWIHPEASLYVLPFLSLLAAAIFLFDRNRESGRLKQEI